MAAMGLSAGVGASRAQNVDEAPSDDEYEAILSDMEGDGSEENPYRLTNVVELQAIGADVQGRYELANDIDASPTADWNDGAGFSPIVPLESDDEETDSDGSQSSSQGPSGFAGVLRGNQHEITGLTIARPDRPACGLVTANQGIIRNLTLSDVSITGLSGGTIASSNGGGLANISVDGSIDAGDTTGGFLGINDGQIVDCEVTVAVTGTETVGGFVGSNTGSIGNSSASGDVEGTNKVGGFAGQSNSEILRSEASGTVTGNSSVGGFVGDQSATVNNSTASGNVSGENKVGGFAGENWGELSGLTAAGAVEGEEQVGGLAGENYSEIRTCSVRGSVTGTSRVGGVVGWGSAGSLITDVFAIAPVTGDSAVGALVGLLGWEFMSESGTVELGQAHWSTDEVSIAAIGQTATGDGEVTVHEDSLSGLPTDQFVGEGATETLSALDFESGWRVRAEDVPVPRGRTPASFDIVDVSESAIQVAPGEQFSLTVEVENTAEYSGTQPVAFLIDGETLATRSETLDPGETTDVTFQGRATDSLAVGSHNFTVRTDDSTVEGSLEVTEASSGGDDTPGDDASGDDTSGDGSTPGSDDSGADDSADDGSDGSGPGFGVGAAITGLGTSAYLLRRRLGSDTTTEE